MQEPKYKLCFNEGLLREKNESLAKDIVMYLLGLLIIIWLVMLVFLRVNILSGASLSALASIIFAASFVSKQGGSVRVESPCELWFYDDYMVQYRPKVYYKRYNIRREYYKFYYEDIHRIQYRTTSKKINIYGILEGTFYKYDKDGNLINKPCYHKTVDAISNFYITYEPNVDFVGILETYTKIKIEVHDS